jgi:prepilin-type N-terminal cleavage/methylation domain-containing protein
MTSSPYSPASNRKRIAGFTLVEVMVATAISAIVLAGILTTTVMIVRSGIRLDYYDSMETQMRRAFEQMGIDARMANSFTSNFTGNVITSFTLTIPSQDMSTVTRVTYGFDTSDSTDQKLFLVPGSDPTVLTGRQVLMEHVTTLTFYRYDGSGTLIPASTTSDAGIKHIQVSISATGGTYGVAAATQVIRSSAFTIRNIAI